MRLSPRKTAARLHGRLQRSEAQLRKRGRMHAHMHAWHRLLLRLQIRGQLHARAHAHACVAPPIDGPHHLPGGSARLCIFAHSLHSPPAPSLLPTTSLCSLRAQGGRPSAAPLCAGQGSCPNHRHAGACPTCRSVGRSAPACYCVRARPSSLSWPHSAPPPRPRCSPLRMTIRRVAQHSTSQQRLPPGPRAQTT